MKNLVIAILVVSMTASLGMASFKLANNGKSVFCTADDNQSWFLNAKRTSIRYTIEGESKRARRITDRDSDGSSAIAYSTDEGTLTLSDFGDTYRFSEDESAFSIDCK